MDDVWFVMPFPYKNMNKMKRSLYRLFICLLIIVVVIFILLHSERVRNKSEIDTAHLLLQIFQFSKIKNYCNNKTRLKGSEYVLSYTLFGKNSWELFGKKVEKVARDAGRSSFYREWKVRVYHDLYPVELQNSLTKIYKNLDFCDVRNLSLQFLPDLKTSNINGRMWRFIAMADPTVDIMCSRDLDSDLFKLEEDAVRYWMRTNKTLHSMRDHPDHHIQILAGLWCYPSTNSLIKASRNLEVMLKNAERRSSTSEVTKEDDQNILQKYLWPELKNDVIQHDSYLCKYYPGSIPYSSKVLAINEIIGCSEQHIQFCRAAKICPKDCRPRDHLDWLYC